MFIKVTLGKFFAINTLCMIICLLFNSKTSCTAAFKFDKKVRIVAYELNGLIKKIINLKLAIQPYNNFAVYAFKILFCAK